MYICRYCALSQYGESTFCLKVCRIVCCNRLCSSCTHALNTAIKGVLKKGDHVVTSSLEHNSVIRPLAELERKGIISLTIVQVYDDDNRTAEAFRQAIKKETAVIICTIASNVTGRILPITQISEICRSKNICLIADGAQACGIIPVSLKKHGINILCTSGHKGLYGITGTGLLITDGRFRIEPLLHGGTGSSSLTLSQPDFLPDALESGTLNTVGIASVGAGIRFLKRITTDRIKKYEDHLADTFISNLPDSEKITVYRSPGTSWVPVVSFNIKDIPSEEAAAILNEKGFCLRAGFHCAPLAHRTLATEKGTVRFAPSVFNNEQEVKKLCYHIKNMI